MTTHSFSKALKKCPTTRSRYHHGRRNARFGNDIRCLNTSGNRAFSVWHTSYEFSIASINRLVDAFPPHQQAQIRTQLAMTLEAVFSQVLIPNRGGRCLALGNNGYDSAISALITEGKINQIYSSMQSGQADSQMQTMNQALAKLVARRIINKGSCFSYIKSR